MKPNSVNRFLLGLRRLLSAQAIFITFLGSANAANRFWDGGTVNIATNGDGASGGTLGNWDTTLTNWDQGTGLAHVAWNNAGLDTAIFAGTGATVTLTAPVSAGALTFTSAGYTIGGTSTLTLGGTSATITSSTLATSATTTISAPIAGTLTSGLSIASSGDVSATGGGASGLGLKLSGTNTFTGTVTITSGLVSYASNAAFGDAANSIVLNGGGLLDNAVSLTLARNIQVGASGGLFRAYGGSTATVSGIISGSGAFTHTDGGILILSGNNTYSGTFTNNGGTTIYSGTNTAATYSVAAGTVQVGNNGSTGSLAAGSTLNIGTAGTVNVRRTDSVNATAILPGTITFAGAGSRFEYNPTSSTAALNLDQDLGALSAGIASTGYFRVSGGALTLASGTDVAADTVSLGLQTNTNVGTLNIGPGSTLTTRFINIGENGNNSGVINQSGGLVTVQTGGNGFRLGHWNNGTAPGSSYNLSGGTLDATAIPLVNIGWDGQGDMTVGGGASAATLKAVGIQLDANGNGGGSGAGDMTLTISNNGSVEVGATGIASAAAGDRVILNGGTLKSTAANTLGSVINANSSTTSIIDGGSNNLILTNNLTGAGTISINAAGSISFSTAGTQTVSPALTGTQLLKKAGTGTTTLSGTSSHSGLFDIDAGRLNLAGSIGSDLLVKSGTTLGGEGSSTNNLVFSAGSKLAIDPTTTTALTFSNLDISGQPSITFDLLPSVSQNPIKLFTYTGTLTGTAATDLIIPSTANYRSAVVTDTSGVVTLDLNVKSLLWNGTTDGNWDLGTSARWNTSEADSFYWGDSVTFNDSGFNTAVTLTGELQPASITVSSITKDYSITGSAGNFISGTTGLVKSGASTLTLNAPNTFTGGVTLSQGTLVGVVNTTTNSFSSGNVTIASGTTARVNNTNTSGTTVTLASTFSGAGELNLQFAAGTTARNTVMNNVTGMTGTIRLSSLGTNADKWSAGGIGTTAASLIVESGSQLYASAGTNTFNGGITVTGTGNSENRGALRVGGTLSGNITLAGSTTIGSEGGTITGNITSGTTGTQTLTFGGAGNGSGTVSGIIGGGTGTIALAHTTTGITTLSGANTYSGGTTISAGSINVRGTTSLGSGSITLGNTGTTTSGLYLDTNRTNFALPVTVSSGGSGTATFGTRSTVTGSGASNGFSNISFARSISLDSNAADRTDYIITSGTGDVTVTGTGRTVFAAVNTFTGNLIVTPSGAGGHIQIGTATGSLTNYIPDAADLTVNNFTGATQAEFRLSSQGETINGLNGAGTIDANAITGTLTVGSVGGSGNFSGDLTGTTLNFAKIGAGTQILSGPNTFTGSVTLSGGTLAISGATGVINATSGVTIGSGTTFTLDNTSTANSVNRLKDTGTVTMNGGTFNFSNNGGAVDYAETTGALSIASGANTITSSQATTPNLSTLTFASLARTAGATVNFTGTGLGVNDQNKILITAQPVGLIGFWATINGTQLAGYDATKGVSVYNSYTDVTRLSSGTKIIADATSSNVQIIEGTGTVGNITLAASTTNINTLFQNANGGPSTVALPAQTLRFGTGGGIYSWPAMGALNIGTVANEGTVTAGGGAINVAGDLGIANNSSELVTVNSIIANNGTGVVTLTKTGTGTAVLAGANTYTGNTTITAGTLEVQTKGGGNANYIVGQNGTFKFGYNVAQTYTHSVTVNGNGASATTGLYLKGGSDINLQNSGGLILSTAPTTIRTYGTGNALLRGYDTNGTHLSVNSAASGSAYVSTINLDGGSFGYVMNISSGASNSTGDMTIAGQLTGTKNYIKTGAGSLALTGASTYTSAMDIRNGSVIVGGTNRLTTTSSVIVGNGGNSGKLILNGNAQTLAGISSAGTGTTNSIVGGNSAASTLTISNTAAVTFPSASTTATLGGAGTNENNLALTKAGAGTLNLGGTNTYTGGTTITGGTLSLASTGAVGTSGSITLNGGTLQFTAANTTDYTATGRLKLADGVVSALDTNSQNVTVGSALALGTLGTGGLGKSGAGTLTITANQAYAGGSSVNAGTLVLSYATANGTKLSDSGTLTLGTGTLTLDGGSHEELVGNTVVTGTAVINRSSGTAKINLGAITRTASNTLDIAADNIAKTSLSNDISGKLPVWITVGGSPAANDGSGNIVAYNGFYNVFRLGGQIPNNAANNVKIVDGGTSGDITPVTPGTTDASSLIQSATGGPAVVRLDSSDILRLGAVGAVSVPSTSGVLTLQDGTLTAGGADDTAGNITFDAGNDIVINSAINKNGTGNVSITKMGTASLTLAANNFYVGGTTINAGELRINHELALGAAPLTINGGTLDNTSGAPITVAESISQTWNSDVRFTGTNDLTFGGGIITLTGSRTVTVDNGTLGLGSSGLINGAFALTKAGSGTLVVGGGNWTGTTTLTGGTLEVPAKTNDVAYVVGSGTTLKLGYTTAGAGANTNLKLTGNGTAATSGLYLKGGANYNANGGIELLSAPTTIRQYGTGLAGIGMWDINGNAISVSAAASGSVVDANIEFTSRGYGNSVNVASGSANSTGDLVINGPLNITLAQSGNTLGFYKRGAGSVALNATGNANNVSLRLEGGSVITGAVDAIGANATVVSSGGTKILMKGFSQAVGSLSGSGAIVNGSATAAVLTVKQTADQTFSGLLGGTGTDENNFSLVKTGASKLTLSAANTYTGNTTVNQGTLSIGSAFLANASDVLITTGATLDLTTGTTDTIDELIVDGTPQAPGVYGSLASSAQFKKAYITGTGTLTVTTGPAGYTSWETLKGISGSGETADNDNDGIKNLLEYILGGDPLASDQSILPTQSVVGANLVLSYKRSDESENDTTQIGQWSTDLVTWNGPVTPVLVNENGSAPDDMTISVPLTNAVDGHLFIRMKASK